MKLTSLAKLAAVSAVALGAALYSTHAEAVAGFTGTAITVTVGGTVENDLTYTLTNANLKFSATGNATDIATAKIDAAGVVTSAPGNGIGVGSTHPASLVFDTGVGTQTLPAIDVAVGGTGTFDGATMFVGIPASTGVVDLTCGGVIKIAHISNDQATPLLWDKPGAGGATGNPGQSVIPAGGNVGLIKFGVWLSTVAGTTSTSYTNGACATPGSFDITIDY